MKMLASDDNNINKCNILYSCGNVHNPPKIHINPKFYNMAAKQNARIPQDEIIQPHINPMFLYRQQKTTTTPKIYMNPNFFPSPNHSMPNTSFNDSFMTTTATTAKTTTTTTAPANKVQQLETTIVNQPAITTTTTKISTPAVSVLAVTTTFGNRYKLDKRERSTKSKPDSNICSNKTFKPSLNRKLQTLNINGVIYKSTGKKLQRKDENGKRNVVITPKRAVKRINNAKQRSLQVLRQKFVKSNIPCPIFRRLGRCRAFEAKKCNKVHDKKYVIICRKFLNGDCHNSGCLLSHDICLNKMPVCRYFLQANCVRDNCPYLHKKLSANASVCVDFLRGFCPLGDKCLKLHDSEHKTLVNFGQRLKAFKLNQNCKAKVPVKEKQKKQQQQQVESQKKSTRYFLSAADKLQENEVIIIEDSDEEIDGDDQDDNVGSRGRTKIGDLPAFIPIS